MNKKETVVINLIGAPSAGKSVMAANLFAKMKIMGLDVEYVTEYAKELVWEKRNDTFRDELYIFAKQNHRLFRVDGKVNFIITDSPIIMKLHYMPEQLDFSETVIKVYEKYNNANIFLTRKNWSFEVNGRNQTEAEARNIERNILSKLEENNIDYLKLPENTTTEEDMDLIVDYIRTIIQEKDLTIQI